MQQTFIIGRSGTQPFKIDDSHHYVHGQHARLTADTAGREWMLEDLKGPGGNGVYVRDEAGDFRRVTACRIKPTDVVRLGPESAQSYTFMAHHVLTPANYNYEFGYVRALDMRLRAEEAAHMATVKTHTRNTIFVPVVLCVLTFIARLFLEIDMSVLLAITAVVTTVPPLLMRYRYRNDNERLKEIKARRAKLLQCPCCWRPLSDYDVRNGRCSACKAM